MKPFFFIGIIFLLTSCNKDDQSPQQEVSKDYLEILVNGKTYDNDVFTQGTGFVNAGGCVSNKPHFLAFLSDIETSSFRFSSYVSHFENETDFAKTVPGAFSIQTGMNSICNLNLSLSYEDKLLTNKVTTLTGTRVNQVTSIKKKGSPNNRTVEYQIQGNFSCSFRNHSGVIIPITGKYQYTVQVYK